MAPSVAQQKGVTSPPRRIEGVERQLEKYVRDGAPPYRAPRSAENAAVAEDAELRELRRPHGRPDARGDRDHQEVIDEVVEASERPVPATHDEKSARGDEEPRHATGRPGEQACRKTAAATTPITARPPAC